MHSSSRPPSDHPVKARAPGAQKCPRNRIPWRFADTVRDQRHDNDHPDKESARLLAPTGPGGSEQPRIPPYVNRRLYLSFVRPITEYAIHLTSLSPGAQLGYIGLERLFLHTAIGPYFKFVPQGRTLLKQEPLEYRRRRLRDKLLARLEENESPELAWAPRALRDARNDGETQSIRQLWEKTEVKLRRIPIPPRKKLAPALALSSFMHRSLAVQWYWHRFTRNPTQLLEQLVNRQRPRYKAGQQALKTLASLLPRAQLTQPEYQEIKQAIEFITKWTNKLFYPYASFRGRLRFLDRVRPLGAGRGRQVPIPIIASTGISHFVRSSTVYAFRPTA